MSHAKFGPAGNPDNFPALGYKSITDVPGILEGLGLNAYEYQCGRGVKISEKSANALGQKALKHGISLSIHSPYYISLSSISEETRLKSVGYILDTAKAAAAMGAKRIVVHSGSCSKMTREQALSLAKDTLYIAQRTLDEQGLCDIILCPETMGKIGQLGTLEEVLALCTVDERFLPCIDFGHLNARTLGGCSAKEDFVKVLDAVENALGYERASVFHSHFSKIEYTAGGEKKHLTFADTVYGPNFEPLAEEIVKRGYHPTFICESAGTQAEDAGYMQQAYFAAGKRE